MKKIVLISTAQKDTKGHKGKTTPCAALGLVAAYTPPDYDVVLLNEQNSDNVYQEGASLAGFSAMTSQIKRSIEVAKFYKARGVPTVVGGIHASVRPEDTLEHFDATVIGEGDHDYAYSLFKRLIPLKKAWVGQASLELSVKDLDLLKLAKRSGCQGLFIGIESVSKVNTPGKLGSSSLKAISEKIKILRDHGLIVNTSTIYGFDHDDRYSFEKTVLFLIKNRVAIANFPNLTPYPGSALFTRLEYAKN